MSSDPERLRAIHDRMTTNPAIVDYIVTEATGEADVDVDRITVGETNEVYAVHATDPLILRINHTSPENFDREEWALDRARERGLPVPTILQRGVVVDFGKDRFYEVQGKLPGVSFDALIEEGMSAEHRNAVTREVGRMMTKLHSIPTTGFGDLDASGKGEHASLLDWFTQIADKREQLREAYTEHGKDPEVCNQAIDLILGSVSLFDGVKPHLVHDDLAPKHVLVTYDNGTPHVSGLLDFELAKSGYLGHELPEWQLRHTESAPTDVLLEGYRQLSPDDRKRQAVASLHKYLVLLDYYAIEEPSVEVAETCFKAIGQLVSR